MLLLFQILCVLFIVLVVARVLTQVCTFPAAYITMPRLDQSEREDTDLTTALIKWKSISIYKTAPLFTNSDSQTPSTPTTILFSHGNGFTLQQGIPMFDAMSRSTLMQVITWDYPGYGLSEGSPSEGTVFRSAETVLAWIQEELKVSMSDVLLVGHSLGTAPTLHLASMAPGCRGIVLLSPFLSIHRTILPWSLPLVNMFDMFDNERLLQHMLQPNVTPTDIHIFHGLEDTLVSPLRSLAASPVAMSSSCHVKWLLGVGHNDIVLHHRVLSAIRYSISNQWR